MAEASAHIVAELQKSRKYRDLCDETLERIAAWALDRYPSQKTATKAAKRKLHQVYGAYVGQVDVGEILALLAQMDAETPKIICSQILQMHVSTAERVDDLEAVFEAIWKVTGQPTRVMDLACGLNPFALPWMGPVKEYLACDINTHLSTCFGQFFENIKFNGKSICHDLLVKVPQWQADVAFLFKVLPCLEQQEKGASLAILKQVPAPHIVVSFPTQTIGGHDRGMAAHYDGFVGPLAADLKAEIQTLVFPRESYYVLSL